MLFKASKLFLYIAIFGVAIVSLSTLFPFIVGKYAWFRTSVDLALIAFLLGLVFAPRDAERYERRLTQLIKTPIGMGVLVFGLAFVVAGFFGVDPSFSFWSNFERGEGGFQMLHLLAFFILLATLMTEERDWRKLFWCAMIAATLMISYGVGASLKFIDAETVIRPIDGVPTKDLTGQGGPWYQTFQNFVGSSFNDPGFRFAGSIGNPAYTATYLLWAMFFTAYLLLWSRKPFRSTSSWIVTAFGLLFFAFFMLAATRGAFLGLAAGAAAALVYLMVANKRARPWLVGLGVALCIVVAIFIYFKDAAFVRNLPFGRVFDISFTTQTFEDRATMWRIAWDAFKERPIFGYGPENFISAFDRHFNIRYFVPSEGFGAWFDRAHSFVFDYLAETGIVGFLAYLAMFIAAGWHLLLRPESRIDEVSVEDRAEKGKLVRTPAKLQIERALFIALPVGHLVQGLVLFEVLTIYMNLFIFFAFLAYRFALPSGDESSAIRHNLRHE